MAAMRVQTENGAEAPNSIQRDCDKDKEHFEEDEEDELQARIQDGTLLPPSVVQPTGRGLARQSRRRKPDGTAPWRAARSENGPAAVNQDVESRVAVERKHRSRQDAKHHGKKSQSGKAGRAYASGGGSKAKTSDKALLDNSLQF